jgi:sialic acid synthase SpsE
LGPLKTHLKNGFFTSSPEPFFFPDIGTFFNQDESIAFELIDRLHDAGCKFLKGEILHSEDICLPKDICGTESYYNPETGKMVTENYRELIERKVISFKTYERIFEHSKKLGMKLVLSVYDHEGISFANAMDCRVLKIASSNINHQHLIHLVAQTGIPMVIDTGKASLEDISRAVQWAKDGGAEDLLIQHSPPAPPKPHSAQNLNFMKTLGEFYGLPFGLSDHSNCNRMLLAAVAIGARVLEKGICQDSPNPDQDVAHALPIGRVRESLESLNIIHQAMGKGVYDHSSPPAKHPSRMGLVLRSGVRAGDEINDTNIGFAFPALSIDAQEWPNIKGKTYRSDLKKGTVLEWGHVKF